MSSNLDSGEEKRIDVMLPIHTNIRTFPQNISLTFTIQQLKSLEFPSNWEVSGADGNAIPTALE